MAIPAREHERLTIADTARFIGEVLPIKLSHREQQQLLSALSQRTEIQFYRARRLCSPDPDDVLEPIACSEHEGYGDDVKYSTAACGLNESSLSPDPDDVIEPIACSERDNGDEDDAKYSTAACELNESSLSASPYSEDGDVDETDDDKTIANTEDGFENTIQSSFNGSQPGCYGQSILEDSSGPANAAPVPLPHQVFDGLPMEYPSTIGNDDGTVGQSSTQQSGYGPPRDCTTAFCYEESDLSEDSIDPTPPSPQRFSSSVSRTPDRSNDDDEFSAAVPDLDCSDRQSSSSASSPSTLSGGGDDDNNNSNASVHTLSPPSPPSIQHFSNYPPGTSPSPRAFTYHTNPISSPSHALAEKTRYFGDLPFTPEWDPPASRQPEWDPPASKQPERVDSDTDSNSPARFLPSPKPSNARKHTKRAVTSYGERTIQRHAAVLGLDTSDIGNRRTAGHVARGTGESRVNRSTMPLGLYHSPPLSREDEESRVNRSRMPRGLYQSPYSSGEDGRASSLQVTEAIRPSILGYVPGKTGVKRGRPPARARGDHIKVEDGDDEVKIKVEDDEDGDEGREKRRRNL